MDSERGYSLLELSLAVGISAALFTGFFVTVAAVNGSIQAISAEAIVPLRVAQALDQMVEDIEQADQVQFDAPTHADRGFRVALGYLTGTPLLIGYEATTSEGVVSVLDRVTSIGAVANANPPAQLWTRTANQVSRSSVLPRGVLLNRRSDPRDATLALLDSGGNLQTQAQPLFILPTTWDGSVRSWANWYGGTFASVVPEITIRLIYRATANSAPSYAVTFCYPKLQR